MGVQRTTLELQAAGGRDTFANGCGVFTVVVAQLVPGHPGHLYLQIDAIEQGTRNPRSVTVDLLGATPAVTFRVAKVAAGTLLRCIFAISH